MILHDHIADIGALESVLDTVAFGDIQGEDPRTFTEANFVKIFVSHNCWYTYISCGIYERSLKMLDLSHFLDLSRAGGVSASCAEFVVRSQERAPSIEREHGAKE